MKEMDAVPESKITSKGQITIPKEVRARLNIRPGDRVRFFFDELGYLKLAPTVPTASLAGSVRSRLGRPATLDELSRGSIAGPANGRKR